MVIIRALHRVKTARVALHFRESKLRCKPDTTECAYGGLGLLPPVGALSSTVKQIDERHHTLTRKVEGGREDVGGRRSIGERRVHADGYRRL